MTGFYPAAVSLKDGLIQFHRHTVLILYLLYFIRVDLQFYHHFMMMNSNKVIFIQPLSKVDPGHSCLFILFVHVLYVKRKFSQVHSLQNTCMFAITFNYSKYIIYLMIFTNVFWYLFTLDFLDIIDLLLWAANYKKVMIIYINIWICFCLNIS